MNGHQNKIQYLDENENIDLLENQLEHELESKLSELKFLDEERQHIGSPVALGETIKNVIWEQFQNQIAVVAGEDFIKDNNNLKLDLRNDAHIQTAENFAQGKFPTHNPKHATFQRRYKRWQKNFKKDENGNIITHSTRTGKEEATLVNGARKPFDDKRPKGNKEKHTDMDHTISAAEIIRDPATNAFLTQSQQIAFANSSANLNEMDASLNRSKGDKSMKDWLDNPNSKGQKPDEIFNISKEYKENLYKKDEKARAKLEKKKKKAEEKVIKEGRQSQKEEAFRVGGKALRAAIMQLLAELIKEIIAKLVKWFQQAKKNITTFIDSLKASIKSFIGKLKTHIFNVGKGVLDTIATAILGPIVRLMKKVWMVLKEGWKSLKEAVAFLMDPKNKDMPISIKMLEVGKIVIAGLSAAGALLLGEVVEKGLMTIPILAFEIPLLGSLASLLGIFIGALIAGITGAIIINKIDKITEKKRKQINTNCQIDKSNEILVTQNKIKILNEVQLNNKKNRTALNISNRHQETKNYMENVYNNIMVNFVSDFSDINNNIIDEEDIETRSKIKKTSDDLDDLLNSLK